MELKDKLIDFVKDFENELAKDFNNINTEPRYFEYCLGMKRVCMSVKSLIRETDIKNLKSVLEQKQKEINRDEDISNSGAYNMYNYIINQMEREMGE